MKLFLVFVFCVLFFAFCNRVTAVTEQWAVLVAGSYGYTNYRHQADVCHAYQNLHHMGIPDDHIIVMMYDDIAHNPRNPHPGVIINRKYGYNVYDGVIKDYVRDEVNPENFMNVLTGRSVNGKKVLKSDSDDNVFVYFTDHGGTDLIAFPHEYMFADELNKTLWYMYSNKMYKNLVFYLESCESGSMFDGFVQSNMNIWAVSAAKPDEDSYACEYVDRVEAYVGDCWSMVWLENSKRIRVQVETLKDQFKVMVNQTNTSTPCKYGDLDNMSAMFVSDFMLNNTSILTDAKSAIFSDVESDTFSGIDVDMSDSVSSRDVALDVSIRAGRAEDFQRELESRQFYDYYFEWCNLSMFNNQKINVNTARYKELIRMHVNKYGMFTDYGLKYTKCLAFFSRLKY